MLIPIRVGRHGIGPRCPPFIVAEMSDNHNDSQKRTLAIVDAAAKASAHVLMIQTYTVDSMTLDVRKTGFVVTNPKSLWKGYSLYDLYKRASTLWEWHAGIPKRCR